MMNEIQVFNNPEFGDIRTVMIEGDPWWVGKDVAEALGYQNMNRDINRHVDEEDRRGYRIGTPGGMQELTVINESGLYSLILSSKLPSAKKFKHWVTSEVLPSIRKTGGYEAEKAAKTKESYLRAAEALSTCPADRINQISYLLRQAGLTIPVFQQEVAKATPAKTEPALAEHKEPVQHWGPGWSFDREEQERCDRQYKGLQEMPQFIIEFPDSLGRHPDLFLLMPEEHRKVLIDNWISKFNGSIIQHEN